MTPHLPTITEDDTEIFQVLISQVAKDGEINAISAKRSAYSDMPSVSSQTAICGLAPTFRPRLSRLNRAFFASRRGVIARH